eukprot:12425477-Karenia_brevis.AAC.1
MTQFQIWDLAAAFIFTGDSVLLMKGKQAKLSAEAKWKESLSSLFEGRVFVEVCGGKGLREIVEGIKAH